MNGIGWGLVNTTSRMLESEERDAVLGDFAESGETAGQALRHVLGLIVRRQVALWRSWRPWLALVVVVLPLALALSFACSRIAGTISIYAWMYVNNWDSAHLENPVFRADFISYIGGFLLQCLTLICWSWTGGFLLERASGRAAPLNGAVFFLLVFGVFLLEPERDHGANAPVFALTFYSLVFPLILRIGLFLLPAFWGMRHGWRMPVVVAMVLVTAGLTASAALRLGKSQNFAPPFALMDAAGETVESQDYRGKVVLLNFWATWCGGCKEEIPWFSEFERKYSERDFAAVGISLDEGGWKVLTPFLADGKASYRMLLGDDRTVGRYGVKSLPATFLIDRKGRIVAAYQGMVNREEVEKKIRVLLSRRQP